MSYSNNIYYHPESSGLEHIAELEYSDKHYQFDTRVVWRQKETRKLFTARDSGCSCPTPFEDFNLQNIDELDDWTDLLEEIEREKNYEWRGNSNLERESASFIAEVRKAAA